MIAQRRSPVERPLGSRSFRSGQYFHTTLWWFWCQLVIRTIGPSKPNADTSERQGLTKCSLHQWPENGVLSHSATSRSARCPLCLFCLTAASTSSCMFQQSKAFNFQLWISSYSSHSWSHKTTSQTSSTVLHGQKPFHHQLQEPHLTEFCFREKV